MTTPTDIDRTAPVIVHHEIDINAPLDTVWRLQTDVNGWPAWQTDITDPRDPHMTGYYIPDDPTQRRGPIPAKLVHQAEDVLVDRRGVIYLSEGNSGIYILTHSS